MYAYIRSLLEHFSIADEEQRRGEGEFIRIVFVYNKVQ